MNETNYWLLRCNNEVLTSTATPGEIFPRGTAADFGHPGDALPVGQWHGQPCYAADVDQLPDEMQGEPVSVRGLFGLGGAEAFALAARASQLLDWQKNHRYCGRCGKPMERKPDEFAMTCPACGLLNYPRISPAVMVLIQRGDDLLLARSPHFREGMFSALAGFVEAGETLEQCAHREVREEVGVEITNLRYFHSQPWPFPDSLMIAFFADYVSGEITPDPSEIEAAGWFPRSALPPLPDPVSIARQLIDAACRKP
jgi:NAD+ diphosphatase